jgi:hypothetical protein
MPVGARSPTLLTDQWWVYAGSSPYGRSPVIEYQPVRLYELVEHYMDSRPARVSVVSVAAVSRAVTTIMPTCPLRPRQLADLIAASAVRHGYAVSFDLEAQAN